MKILATQKNMTSFRGSMLNRQRDKIGRFLPNPLIKRDAHMEAQRLVEDFVEIAAKEKTPKLYWKTCKRFWAAFKVAQHLSYILIPQKWKV